MKSTTLNIRIEPDIKEQAEAVFRQLGLSSTTAVNLFFRQVILHGGIPFALMTGQSQPLGSFQNPLSTNTIHGNDGQQQITDEGVPAVIRQVRKPHTRKARQTAQEPSSSLPGDIPAGKMPSAKHIIPAFSTFDDDQSRAEAWLKQHDDEGI